MADEADGQDRGTEASGAGVEPLSYFDSKPVLDTGSVHITAQEEHRVSIPMIASIVKLVAGIGPTIIGRRAA